MPKEQLCWTCQNACGGCSWSASLTPVEGWTATPSTIKSAKSKEVPTYHIDECPLYKPDRTQRPKPKRKKGKGITNGEKNLILGLYNEGMTITEIARQVNLSRNTVKKYCKKV